MSSISEEEDSGPSLKELVTKNLESNGILGKLQAQLRASIFLILEEEFQEKNIPLTNKKAHDLLSTSVGKIAITLVQDFLQCLNLDFTLTVFCPETKSVLTEHSANRDTLNKEFGSYTNSIQDGYPYLFKLIEDLHCIHKTKNKNNDKKTVPSRNPPTYDKATGFNSRQNLESGQNNSYSPQTSPKELSQTMSSSHTENHSTKDDVSGELYSNSKSSRLSGKKESKDVKSVQKDKETESVSRSSSSKSTNISSSANKTSLKSSSSLNKNGIENGGDSSQSSSVSSSSSGKETLSGLEKVYEDEDFSSTSDPQTLQNSSRKSSEEEANVKKFDEKSKIRKDGIEEKSEIEEAVETAEDIEEDITSLDDLLSSNSEMSNQTKDITASKESNVADYEETL